MTVRSRVNLIVRGADGRVYQIKSTALESLSVPAKARESDPALATLTGKAVVQDITDPLNPVSVAGNARLQVTLTDRGEPGSADSIAVNVWNSNGTQLLFSSRWTGSKTVEQVLAAGNLQVRVASPLQAASWPSPGTGGADLTAEQLRPLVQQAISRWAAAGLSAAELEALCRAEVQIADLEDGYLGFAGSDTVWIDADAAGWGWFVDPTPWDDGEFITPGNQGEQGQVDLLSVLVHELGHLLGHDHDEDGAMAETLAPGVRTADMAAPVGSGSRPVDGTVALSRPRRSDALPTGGLARVGADWFAADDLDRSPVVVDHPVSRPRRS